MDIIIPEFLDKEISKADIIVFEGFEMTGKSTLAHEIERRYKPNFLYRPDWEEVLPSSVVSRGNRYIPGIAMVDAWGDMMLDGIIPPGTKLLLDRWMASSLVYYEIYNQSADFKDMNSLVNAFKKSARDFKVLFIHKNHASREEARTMYDITKKNSSSHNDAYDHFNGFDDYFVNYLSFEKVYDKFYSDVSPFPVMKLSSLTNEQTGVN